MADIEHIVHVMFENRSFDNVLGWLYDDATPSCFLTDDPSPTFDGLDTARDWNEDRRGRRHHVVKGTGGGFGVPRFDPGEAYEHVNRQLFGPPATPAHGTEAHMGGFLRDYAAWYLRSERIMMSYTREELPVLNGLARRFAVSDRYFSSVPTQTNSNRAFAAAGNSLGLDATGRLGAWVDNRSSATSSLGRPRGTQFNQRTIWDVLLEADRHHPDHWMIFNSQGTWLENRLRAQGYAYTRAIMESLQDPVLDDHFSTVGDPAAPTAGTFFDLVARGRLPAFSFIEPKWGLPLGRLPLGVQGNEYHPPFDVRPGERFLKQIYDALTADPATWERVLLIVNFDEHGGTYDHVRPPWTAVPPWHDDPDTPTPEVFEHGFQFDRFGVRVPLLLVSPWVTESTVFRARGPIPYDHTSVIATVLRLLGIDRERWRLGARVANAPPFDDVLADRRRMDVPTVEMA